MTDSDWERRLDHLWASMDDHSEADFVARMAELVGELPDGDPVGLYERGGSYDSTGQPEAAISLYRQALANGLAGERRRRAVIQLASSLRNLGRIDDSVALLTAERATGSDPLDDAVSAFLALAMVDAGRAREATSIALAALAPHLPRYQRSVANYARLLTESD